MQFASCSIDIGNYAILTSESLLAFPLVFLTVFEVAKEGFFWSLFGIIF